MRSFLVLAGFILVTAVPGLAQLSPVERLKVTFQCPACDLRRVDLTGAFLGDVNLSKAQLFRANLRKANLATANLRQADLFEADLRDANLLFANLQGADLRRADLRGASLAGADLRNANLYHAKTDQKTIWLNAKLSGATLPNGKKGK